MKLLTLLITNPIQIVKLFQFLLLAFTLLIVRNFQHVFMVTLFTIDLYFFGVLHLMFTASVYVAGHYLGKLIFYYRYK